MGPQLGFKICFQCKLFNPLLHKWSTVLQRFGEFLWKLQKNFLKKTAIYEDIPRYARIWDLQKNRDMRIRAVRNRVMRGLPLYWQCRNLLCFWWVKLKLSSQQQTFEKDQSYRNGGLRPKRWYWLLFLRNSLPTSFMNCGSKLHK